MEGNGYVVADSRQGGSTMSLSFTYSGDFRHVGLAGLSFSYYLLSMRYYIETKRHVIALAQHD